MTAAWLLLVVLLLAWGWMDTLRARETALMTCARACRQLEAQLLDETVALQHLWFARDGRGRVHWRRTYGFEFSMDGVGRRQGMVVVLGRQITSLWLDHPDGPIYMPSQH